MSTVGGPGSEPTPWEGRSVGDLTPVDSRHHEPSVAGIVPLVLPGNG